MEWTQLTPTSVVDEEEKEDAEWMLRIFRSAVNGAGAAPAPDCRAVHQTRADGTFVIGGVGSQNFRVSREIPATYAQACDVHDAVTWTVTTDDAQKVWRRFHYDIPDGGDNESLWVQILYREPMNAYVMK